MDNSIKIRPSECLSSIAYPALLAALVPHLPNFFSSRRDPEGLLRTRETNLIDRNLMKRRMSQV